MEMCVRMLPKKRKFDPSEYEKPETNAGCVPVSVVQSNVPMPSQITAVDYSRSLRPVEEEIRPRNPTVIDLSEWCDHRVLSKQGDWYYPGVIRQAVGSEVSFTTLLDFTTLYNLNYSCNEMVLHTASNLFLTILGFCRIRWSEREH